MGQRRELVEEIAHLRAKPSNIPNEKRRLRAALAEALTLDETRLPFVGELIQVDERELDWEAAIERLPHGFALSLLVDDQDYARFTEYVELQHLRDRLVYLRVRKIDIRPAASLQARSLTNKLQIKGTSINSPFLRKREYK